MRTKSVDRGKLEMLCEGPSEPQVMKQVDVFHKPCWITSEVSHYTLWNHQISLRMFCWSETWIQPKCNLFSCLTDPYPLSIRCGHCKRLAPEYEAAATRLKGIVSLAKVLHNAFHLTLSTLVWFALCALRMWMIFFPLRLTAQLTATHAANMVSVATRPWRSSGMERNPVPMMVPELRVCGSDVICFKYVCIPHICTTMPYICLFFTSWSSLFFCLSFLLSASFFCFPLALCRWDCQLP